MTKDEALTLALEALEALDDMHIVDFPLEDLRNWNKAINAIKEALAQPDHIRDATKMMAQPVQEPVARVAEVHMSRYTIEWTNGPLPEGAELFAAPISPLPVAAGSQAFYGFPHGPVSTPNAGGKCVTAGETAPPKEIDPNQWAFDNGLEST